MRYEVKLNFFACFFAFVLRIFILLFRSIKKFDQITST